MSLGKDGGTIKTSHKILGCSRSATNLGPANLVNTGGVGADPTSTMQLEYGVDGDTKTLNIVSSIKSGKSKASQPGRAAGAQPFAAQNANRGHRSAYCTTVQPVYPTYPTYGVR